MNLAQQRAITTTPSTSRSPLRMGTEYLKSAREGRRVYLDGELVKDVTAHPALRAAARSLARLYDIAATPTA